MGERTVRSRSGMPQSTGRAEDVEEVPDRRSMQELLEDYGTRWGGGLLDSFCKVVAGTVGGLTPRLIQGWGPNVGMVLLSVARLGA